MPSCPVCGVPVDHAARRCEACTATFEEPELEFWESRLSAQQEAGVRTPGWFLPVLGISGIGGGSWGIVGVATALTNGQLMGGWLMGIIGMAMLMLSCFAIWCGVMALQRRRGWLWANSLLWVLQVVKISSPLLAVAFSVGAHVTFFVSVPPLNVGVNALLGTTAEVNLLTPMPWGIGINLLALAVAAYLFRLRSRAQRGSPAQRAEEAVEPADGATR